MEHVLGTATIFAGISSGQAQGLNVVPFSGAWQGDGMGPPLHGAQHSKSTSTHPLPPPPYTA